MALLVVHLPPHPRLHPGRADVPASEAATSVAELDFVYSSDGITPAERGRCAPALLPGLANHTTEIVGVLGEAALSWHRIVLPKAAGPRLRAALTGVLEDVVLDEPSALHVALQPGAQAGQPCWMAVTDRPWLAAQLQALEEAGVVPSRLVPIAAPQAPGTAHMETLDESVDTFAHTVAADLSTSLTWAHADGVLHVPLVGTASQSLIRLPLPEGTLLSASPAAAMAAERWFGEPVTIVGPLERWLLAARGDWDLRQFELAARHRGSAALRRGWTAFTGPAWRPVRWGLIGLVALQVIGLNLWASHQRGRLRDTRAEMVSLVQGTFPEIQAVLDAPLQMQRQTDLLRAAAGKPGDGDLERLLQVTASAWPADQPVQSLRFEPGQLSVSPGAMPRPQIEGVRATLQTTGWQAELADQVLTVRPGRGGTAGKAAQP